LPNAVLAFQETRGCFGGGEFKAGEHADEESHDEYGHEVEDQPDDEVYEQSTLW